MSAPFPRKDSRRDLDPARAAERERVSTIVAATLQSRGVRLTGSETSDQLADILSAVERFEAAVSALGGDRMVNDRNSNQPENELFVLPARTADESPGRYADRVLSAAEQLLQRPE